jgi:leader peptidase (prepilin peptidase) / N-methyltransferase
MNELVLMAVFWFVIGAILASFLGVVAARLPKVLVDHQNNPEGLLGIKIIKALSTPRSSCEHCGKELSLWHLVPILGYIFLRGRCGFCGKPIAWRYLVVEIIFGLALATFWLLERDLITVALLAVFFGTALVLALIDLDSQILPDELTLSLVWLGLLVNLNGQFIELNHAVIGAAAGYLSLWLIYQMFYLFTGREGLGYGDFKLFAAVGAWFGFLALPVVIFCASGVALLYFGYKYLKGRMKFNAEIPFGPFIVAGAFFVVVFVKLA